VTVVFVPAWGMIFSTQAVREKKETIKIKQALNCCLNAEKNKII
jgi:hypothetical protein